MTGWADREAQVLAWGEAWIRARAHSAAQAQLLSRALHGLRFQIESWDTGCRPVFIHLPLSLYAGLTGRAEDEALPLAGLGAFLFLALDTLDDLTDGDDPHWWEGISPAQRSLAASTLLCAVPQKILAELEAPAELRDRLQRILAEGYLEMSAGQQRDLAHQRSPEVTLEAVEQSLQQKSGAEFATLARLTAELAGASAARAESCAEIGRALGTASQLGSDCFELFQDPEARDFRAGARTYPIVAYLQRLSGAERGTFLDLLDRARSEEAARQEVRERLRTSGDLRRAAFRVEVHVQRGIRHLREAALLQPAYDRIEAMLRGVSFFTTV